MTNLVEDRGFFWWWDPSQESLSSSAASGLLTINDRGEIKLELDQELLKDRLSHLPMDEARAFPQGRMINGKLNRSHEFVLLDSLRLIGWSWSDTAIRPETYTAETCLSGYQQFEFSHSTLQFHHMRIDLAGFEEWLNLDAICSTIIDYDEENVEFSIKYKPQKFTFSMPDFSLFIETITTTPTMLFAMNPHREAVFRQEIWLQYEKHLGSDIASLQDEFIKLEEFFAILTGSYSSLNWPYAVQGLGPNERWYKLCFFRGSPMDYKPDLNNTITWFVWSRDFLGELFTNWKIKRAQYGPGYYLYLAALRNSSVYVEHRFINLVWALESLHRQKGPLPGTQVSKKLGRILGKFQDPADRKDLKWLEGRLRYSGEPSLEERIIKSFKFLPLGIPLSALRTFAKRCADRRNMISHKGGPSSSETYDAFHQDLIYLSEAFRYLYHALLLDEVGFDKSHIHEGFTNTFLARSKILPSLQVLDLIPDPKPFPKQDVSSL